jgi:hypothetical protein
MKDLAVHNHMVLFGGGLFFFNDGIIFQQFTQIDAKKLIPNDLKNVSMVPDTRCKDAKVSKGRILSKRLSRINRTFMKNYDTP